MSNSYNYIDPDFSYIDPNTGLLRNLQNITDSDVLLFVESGAVIKRLQELYEKPLKIKGINTLFEIHRHLFQDIYDWAGKKRMVEISKEGKQFFPTSHFNHAFRYIDQLIA
jgi:cell filamentation protein